MTCASSKRRGTMDTGKHNKEVGTLAIERYETDDMRQVWSDAGRVAVWASVEAAAAEAQGAPAKVVAELRNRELFPTLADVESEEETTRHDVVAFLQAWRRNLSDEAGRWLHHNMTSSDLVDSANGVRLEQSFWVLDRQLGDLVALVAKHAINYRDTVRVARTHGQHAEVSTWGFRVAGFAHNLQRARLRLLGTRNHASTGKLSGPVGDYKRVTPDQERRFLDSLDLAGVPVATQVVPRAGYADFVWACAQIASALEDMALEVRLCQRSEVGELAEGFAPGQRGSSAMPHKRNPITAERLCGLARLIRAQVMPVLEGVALHHERDIAHSSVERVAVPTVCHLTHFALLDATALWRHLVVNVGRMQEIARGAQSLTLSAFVKNYLTASGLLTADQVWQAVYDGARNPHGNLVEETKTAVRKNVGDDVAEAIDWTPLFKESFVPLLNRVGDTDRVFDDLITLT